MIINFRQGIISYDTSIAPFSAATSPGGVDVTINVGTQPFVATVASLAANYLWSESQTIDAWPNLSSTGTYWLYFDFNPHTFVRTFGTTTLSPINQNIVPTTPATGQHWFNTTTNQMFVWSGSVWNPVIRVFACKFVAPATFLSLGSNGPSSFTGTQIGNFSQNVTAGQVIYDNNGYPITRYNGTFFTTEDQVFAEGSAITAIRLESNAYTAQSASPSIIPAYYAVAFNTAGQVYTATYNDAGVTAIALALQQINFGGTGAILLEGTVTNPNWNWAGSIGSLLWISGSIPGVLQNTDPHLDNPVVYPIQRVPVARVIGPSTIIFLQGIGTKGDPGPSGSSSISLATSTTPGTVYLSVDGGTLSSPTPTVVSEIDPRLTDARTPLPHSQAATTITVTPYTSTTSGISFSGPYAQQAFQQISDASVALAGSTMTGALVLSADPMVALGAATKQYVDNAVGSNTAYVAKSGSTMTGALILNANPTSSLGAATKQYVDTGVTGVTSQLGNYLLLTGGTLTGALTLSADPTSSLQAATKHYVDNLSSLPNLVIPYDLAFFIGGNMTVALQVVGAYLTTRAIILPAAATGSLAKCGVAPATNISYSIQQNSASVGTVSFTSGNTTGTVSFTAQINLAVGDIFTIVTPLDVDSSIQNVYITLVGSAAA